MPSDGLEARLLAKVIDLKQRLRANRYKVHAGCCDDGDDAVPCASGVCAIEYEAELLLAEVADELAAALRIVDGAEARSRAVAALVQAETRREDAAEAEAALVDQRVLGHGEGQEHAIADAIEAIHKLPFAGHADYHDGHSRVTVFKADVLAALRIVPPLAQQEHVAARVDPRNTELCNGEPWCSSCGHLLGVHFDGQCQAPCDVQCVYAEQKPEFIKAAEAHAKRTLQNDRERLREKACADEVEAALRIVPPLAQQEWQDISTAPKEQRVLVVLKPQPLQTEGDITFAYFVMTLPDYPEGVWTYDETGECCVPTHWLPLPVAPLASPQDEKNDQKEEFLTRVDGDTQAPTDRI